MMAPGVTSAGVATIATEGAGQSASGGVTDEQEPSHWVAPLESVMPQLLGAEVHWVPAFAAHGLTFTVTGGVLVVVIPSVHIECMKSLKRESPMPSLMELPTHHTDRALRLRRSRARDCRYGRHRACRSSRTRTRVRS
jgi:hypothetical protein